MGQRSQIYVRVNRADGRKYLFPRYYSWNYGERMVSRTRGIIEWLHMHTQHPEALITDTEYNEKIKRIMDTNFDYRDVVIGKDIIDIYFDECKWLEERIYERGDFEQIIFAGQDNNDGQVFIDMIVDFDHKDKNGNYKYEFKYAFRTSDEDSWEPLDPEQYMDWDFSGWRTSEYMKDAVKLTERNINYIKKHAKLMTSDEMFDYAHHDYVDDMFSIRRIDCTRESNTEA